MTREDRRSSSHDYTDADRGPRLQKVMANAGFASRRDSEAVIEAGRVKVNGQVVRSLPAWVDPQRDVIEVDGEALTLRKVAAPRGRQGRQYFIANKPRRVIATTDDPAGRTDVLDLLPEEITARHRLYPVGRLDSDSTGLILLTDDGDLAHQLTHPSFEVPKQYLVTVRGKMTEADTQRLRDGLVLADRSISRTQTGGKKAQVAQIERVKTTTDKTRGDRTQLRITLTEGQNRQIRRMLARLGFKVRRLHRLAIGPITLKGLGIGQWRKLTAREVAALRRAARGE